LAQAPINKLTRLLLSINKVMQITVWLEIREWYWLDHAIYSN